MKARPCADKTTAMDSLIEQYYVRFNDRRLDDAAALLAEDVVLEHVFFGDGTGRAGYRHIAASWLAAFPNLAFTLEHVERRSETIREAFLLATGTHRGVLHFSNYRFEPTQANVSLHVRELLDIQDEKIVAAAATVDFNDVLSQLAMPDYADLRDRLRRISVLSEELTAANGDGCRQREVITRLGNELDAARRAVRPHFNR